MTAKITAKQAETGGAIQEVFGCPEVVTHQYSVGGGFRTNAKLCEVYEGYTIQETTTE